MTVMKGRGMDKTGLVRIARELMAPLDDLVENARDQYGIPLFKSRSDAVTAAVKDLLTKYSSKEAAKS